MRVHSLRLKQFRNFPQLEIEFCPGTNLLVGRNGQGKTNLIEAVYFLGFGKSFRTGSPRECIRHRETECRIDGRAGHQDLIRDLGVSISLADEKRLTLFGKPAGIAEFIGNFHVLAFTQEHLKIVRGGPAERRAFLDRAMLTVFPGHMSRLAAYGRALKQRNQLLGSALGRGIRADPALIESWDEKLVQEGSRILADRIRYVTELRRLLPGITGDLETLEIRYTSSIPTEDGGNEQISDGFRRKLLEARPVDERKGFTSAGPHRDDLRLLLNGKPLDRFGSAGQQRSSLLSLYFAQMEIHRKTCGFYPAFLMDDVEAELDDQRLRAFLDHLSERTQTFLTTAKGQALPPLRGDTRLFMVEGGSIRIQPS